MENNGAGGPETERPWSLASFDPPQPACHLADTYLELCTRGCEAAAGKCTFNWRERDGDRARQQRGHREIIVAGDQTREREVRSISSCG